MANSSPRSSVRPFARSSVRTNAPSPSNLERCARAAAEASGYKFTGASLLTSAETNPRAAQFVTIARAVINEYDRKKGA